MRQEASDLLRLLWRQRPYKFLVRKLALVELFQGRYALWFHAGVLLRCKLVILKNGITAFSASMEE
jgi:hypothetical protein